MIEAAVKTDAYQFLNRFHKMLADSLPPADAVEDFIRRTVKEARRRAR